jgi:hypothetical protein
MEGVRAPNAASVWGRLGVERTYGGVPTTAAADLLRDAAAVVANPHVRYVWRGQGNIHHSLHHSLHRRIVRAAQPETEAALDAQEARLVRRARAAGYDHAVGRKLADVELVGLLQHEGAATRFLDVTTDPFIALFFACEHAIGTDASASLVALLVPDDWPIRPRLDSFGPGASLDQLDTQRASEGEPASTTYLIETPFLNERMKAQRGAFIAGRLPTDPDVAAWSSLDISLLAPNGERQRIDRLLNPVRGRPPARGERPPVIAFRIRATVRRALREQLAARFGYTTETIYPDLNGFARAFDQYAPLA